MIGHLDQCERKVRSDVRCDRPASMFALGQSLCTGHEPAGDPNCSHSLVMNGRCSFCGAKT